MMSAFKESDVFSHDTLMRLIRNYGRKRRGSTFDSKPQGCVQQWIPDIRSYVIDPGAFRRGLMRNQQGMFLRCNFLFM